MEELVERILVYLTRKLLIGVAKVLFSALLILWIAIILAFFYTSNPYFVVISFSINCQLFLTLHLSVPVGLVSADLLETTDLSSDVICHG